MSYIFPANAFQPSVPTLGLNQNSDSHSADSYDYRTNEVLFAKKQSYVLLN